MDARDSKKRLRKEYLKKRKALYPEPYRRFSNKIIHRLKQQEEFQHASTIHSYVSVNPKGEVDTQLLLKQMIESGKKVVVPLTHMEEGTLSHIRLTSLNQLKPNRWGIQEPEGGQQVDVEELDLVIVPMVAGDIYKNRMGYGKGFYDRFLSQVHCPAIGLIFEECLSEDKLPVDSHDVPLTKIITERRVIN